MLPVTCVVTLPTEEGENGVPPAGEPDVVGRAKGFVPVAAGMSGCAAGGCANGEVLLGGVGVFCGLAKGLVFWPEGEKGLGAPVAVGIMDCRKGLVD